MANIIDFQDCHGCSIETELEDSYAHYSAAVSQPQNAVWTLPVMPELSFSKACFPFAHYSSIMLGSAKGGLQGD